MNKHRISPKETELLACIELAADLPLQSIAQRLGWKVHRVQYLLKTLQERGVYRSSAFIDIHRLGLRYCGVFLSLRGAAEEKDRVIKRLSQDERVGWLAELGGPYQLGLAVVTRSPKAVDDFLGEIVSGQRVSIYKKAVAFRLYLADLPRYYLSTKALDRRPLAVCDGVAEVKLDELDLNILAALSARPEASLRHWAKDLGMAHTSLNLRLQRLKKLGVLIGTTIELDLNSLGRQGYKLLLHSRGRNSGTSKRLRAYACAHPLIGHYVECLGEWDYELNVEAASAEELKSVVNNLQEEFGDELTDITMISLLKVLVAKRFPLHCGAKARAAL